MSVYQNGGYVMKKILAACTIFALSLFAVGCEKTIDLTDEENQLIAEYSAELLLKYDRNYSSKYFGNDQFVSPHKVETASNTDASTEEPASTEKPTTTEDKPDDNKTPSNKPDVATGSDAPNNNSSHGNNGGSSLGMEDVTSELKADYKHSDFDLADYVGMKNVSIKYQYSMITDTYPSYDSSGVYIGVEAPKGYKLVILKFRIENLTDSEQNIDLYGKDISYKIILDNKKSTKQMFTILMDDLYTYQETLGESSISDAVLLFQVADSVADSTKDMKLQVEYKDKKAIVQLQ